MAAARARGAMSFSAIPVAVVLGLSLAVTCGCGAPPPVLSGNPVSTYGGPVQGLACRVHTCEVAMGEKGARINVAMQLKNVSDRPIRILAGPIPAERPGFPAFVGGVRLESMNRDKWSGLGNSCEYDEAWESDIRLPPGATKVLVFTAFVSEREAADLADGMVVRGIITNNHIALPSKAVSGWVGVVTSGTFDLRPRY